MASRRPRGTSRHKVALWQCLSLSRHSGHASGLVPAWPETSVQTPSRPPGSVSSRPPLDTAAQVKSEQPNSKLLCGPVLEPPRCRLFGGRNARSDARKSLEHFCRAVRISERLPFPVRECTLRAVGGESVAQRAKEEHVCKREAIPNGEASVSNDLLNAPKMPQEVPKFFVCVWWWRRSEVRGQA